MKKTDILVINPGSTTTKIGVFENLEPLFEVRENVLAEGYDRF